MQGLVVQGVPVRVMRKQTYTQADTGEQKYVVEVAGFGFTLAVMYQDRGSWDAAPAQGQDCALSGEFTPGFQPGTYRFANGSLAVASRPKSA